MTTPRKIELRKWDEGLANLPADRKTIARPWDFYRHLVVDGERWADIYWEGHGSHGRTYQFLVDGTYLETPAPWKGDPERTRRFSVPSDNGARRRAERNEKVLPLDSRLVEAVRTLIDSGHLMSPADRKAHREAANKAWRESRAIEAAKEAAEFEARAHEALVVAGLLPADEENAAAVEAIVAAMRWAQTR